MSDTRENLPISRRGFFSLLTKTALTLAGALGFVGLIRYFSFRPDPGPPARFDLGPKDDFPAGSMTIRADIPAVIFNRDGEYLAFSLSCTHLGCALEQEQGGFLCPCHGSRFDQHGRVLAGPADQNLPKLKIELSEGESLILHTKGATK